MLSRMAAREATRRRGQTALVVGGLMVGTATITAALIAADSVGDSTTDAFAYRNWGYVDLTVMADGNRFFDAGVAAALSADETVRGVTDGIAAGIEVVGSASDLTTRQGTSGVTIVGFNPAAQQPFGAFTLTDGRRTTGEDMPGGSVLISRTLADKLDAKAGDRMRIRAVAAGLQGAAGTEVRLFGVARSEGPGAYTLGSVVFAPLPTVQSILGTTQINVVRLSAPGGIRDADDAARAAAAPVRAAVERVAPNLEVETAKLRAVGFAAENTMFLRAMLTGMSAIVVAAGAALVVNITGMLAEERRARLGVMRALGLRRRKVVALSVIEGAMYALAAGIAGAIVGVAAGRLVASRFGRAFAEFAGEDFDFEFFFSLRPETLATGFAVGSVLTLIVIAIASRRTARMTITAAIRDLPEPPPEKPRRRWPRSARLMAGALAGLFLVSQSSIFPRMAGAELLTVVASAFVRPRLKPRVHGTLTGLAMAAVAFGLIAGQAPEGDPAAFFGGFVIAMLSAVFGLTILVTANLHVVERGVSLAGRALSRLIAIVRPPIAYLSRRPMRTGLTTGVFALIVAMLTLFAVFLVIFQPSLDQFSAGYDVRLLSTGSPEVTIPDQVQRDVERVATIPTRGYVGPIEGSGPFSSADRAFVPLLVAPSDAPSNPPVRLFERSRRYPSDEAAWQAILRDPTLVVSNFGEPDAKITLRGQNGPVTFTVVGSHQFGLLDGVFASPQALKPFESAPLGASLLIDLRDGADARAAARTIERELFGVGVDADSTQDLYDTASRGSRAFFSTIDVLMRLGLVVGILSLGIVAMRVVIERRQLIGMLRAIGYKRKHVLAGLMAEAAATATIGVAVGATVGLLMGYIFSTQQEGDTGFGVDWGSFFGVLGVVYVAVTIVALGPAWRASRLPPAEAVRYSE